MAGNKSIESRRSKLNEIGNRIQEKADRADQLEKAKTEARNARMEIENMENLDDDAKAEAVEVTNEAYEQASEEAEAVSEKLGEDIKELESLREETGESLDAANEAKNREDELARSCAENGIIFPKTHGLESNIRGNDALLNDIIEKMQDANNIATRLGGI